MTRPLSHALERRLLLLLFLAALFSVLLTGDLRSRARLTRLTEDTLTGDFFREHELSEAAIREIRMLPREERSRAAALYFLSDPKNIEKHAASFFTPDSLRREAKLWRTRPPWENYLAGCRAIWEDVVCFPVPASTKHKNYTVTYTDSWMNERSFGGKRGHEGTDLMASENTPGLYPVVSMTDGVVESLGWLPKGGWRIGIRAPLGGYFYYAHLDSYAKLEVGDRVSAGDLLGFMGNTGYGPEGTKGMFATHLHIGIYIYPDGAETSVNPYWILRMIEEKKLSCSF